MPTNHAPKGRRITQINAATSRLRRSTMLNDGMASDILSVCHLSETESGDGWKGGNRKRLTLCKFVSVEHKE